MTPLEYDVLTSMDNRLTGMEEVLSKIVAALNDMPHVVVNKEGEISFKGPCDITRPILKQMFDTRLRDILKEHQIQYATAMENLNTIKRELSLRGTKAVVSMQVEAQNKMASMEATVNKLSEKAQKNFEEIKKQAVGITRSAMILSNEVKVKAGIEDKTTFYRKR